MDDKFSVRQFASECGYVDGDGGVLVLKEGGLGYCS